MQRYSLFQIDGSTFVVIDQVEQREICVCANYDEWEDAEERTQKIAALMNENLENKT